jgi:hypothetical protein
VFLQWAKQLGGIYRLYSPGVEMLVLSDPTLIASVVRRDQCLPKHPLYACYEQVGRVGLRCGAR